MNNMEYVCELTNVSKSYKEHMVLDKINICVEKSEMIAIMGKSGSGKSTLLNIIGLLERPDNGTIKLFGEEVLSIKSIKANKILKTKLAYLFQNYALIDNETVESNLEIPLLYSNKKKSEKREMKIDALKKVDLNVPLNQKIYELSGGEQQRVAIARILLKEYKLILADEPTGSLDDENRDEIIKILKDINSTGKAVIIVTHDDYVAKSCSRIIKLS